MKKLTSILMSVCMLTIVCSLTSCGGEKWEYAEDEGVSVSNSNCSDIVSDKAKENIREKLEDKYKDVKPKVNEESIKGLLKEEITLEKDDDYYFAESVRAEELDSIFEVNGHTAEAYVDVSVYPDEEFMEYEMYAEYGGDTYCFAEVDFILPAKKGEAEEGISYHLMEFNSGKKVLVSPFDSNFSEDDKKYIADKLEERYKKSKINVIKDNVSGLLKGKTLKLDDDSVYAEELDDLLSGNGHTVEETNVRVSVSPIDEDAIRFSINGKYDDTFYSAYLDFKPSTAKEE